MLLDGVSIENDTTMDRTLTYSTETLLEEPSSPSPRVNRTSNPIDVGDLADILSSYGTGDIREEFYVSKTSGV